MKYKYISYKFVYYYVDLGLSHRMRHTMSPCPLRLFRLASTILECPHVSSRAECSPPVRHLRFKTSFVIQLPCCPCPGCIAPSYLPLTIATLTCSEKVGWDFSCVDAPVPMSLALKKTTLKGICPKCLNYRDPKIGCPCSPSYVGL